MATYGKLSLARIQVTTKAKMIVQKVTNSSRRSLIDESLAYYGCRVKIHCGGKRILTRSVQSAKPTHVSKNYREIKYIGHDNHDICEVGDGFEEAN